MNVTVYSFSTRDDLQSTFESLWFEPSFKLANDQGEAFGVQLQAALGEYQVGEREPTYQVHSWVRDPNSEKPQYAFIIGIGKPPQPNSYLYVGCVFEDPNEG